MMLKNLVFLIAIFYIHKISAKNSSDIFGSLPLITDLKISPDGLKTASLQSIFRNIEQILTN